jgi:hypothetical protein
LRLLYFITSFPPALKLFPVKLKSIEFTVPAFNLNSAIGTETPFNKMNIENGDMAAALNFPEVSFMKKVKFPLTGMVPKAFDSNVFSLRCFPLFFQVYGNVINIDNTPGKLCITGY